MPQYVDPIAVPRFVVRALAHGGDVGHGDVGIDLPDRLTNRLHELSLRSASANHEVGPGSEVLLGGDVQVESRFGSRRSCLTSPTTPTTVAQRGTVSVHDSPKYAHARGVIHRDVKPENLMIERGTGRVIVTDFGVARDTRATRMTRDGWILGSVHYMSPEQAAGDQLDGRSDLYALGIIGWQALTGRLPFESEEGALLSYRTDGRAHVLPRCLTAMELTTTWELSGEPRSATPPHRSRVPPPGAAPRSPETTRAGRTPAPAAGS